MLWLLGLIYLQLGGVCSTCVRSVPLGLLESQARKAIISVKSEFQVRDLKRIMPAGTIPIQEWPAALRELLELWELRGAELVDLERAGSADGRLAVRLRRDA